MNTDFERYHLLYKETQDSTLRPGQTFKLEFDGATLTEQPASHRLFFTGETALFYLWKSEEDYPMLYRQIDDALDYHHTNKSQFCLNLSSSNVDYLKRVYKKLLWKPILSYLPLYGYSDQWTGGLFVKANQLTIYEGGYLRMLFELRYKKPGVSRHSVIELPDAVFTLNLPQGTFDWTEVKIPLSIPVEETASVCIFIEGLRYEGSVYLERPFLTTSGGRNILPGFSVASIERPHFNWLGQNLSKKEWPEFEIKLNGDLLHRGEIFERSHRYSETEIEIPAGLIQPGCNRLEMKLISAYREALPYAVHEVGIVASPRNVFNIIACPEVAAAGRPFPVLIETHQADLRLEFHCASGAAVVVSNLHFEAEGLYVIHLLCSHEANDVAFHLSATSHEENAVVPRVVRKPTEEVITGTGDLIYINQAVSDTLRYLKWYVANHIGNLLTIRPTYRWSGTRELNPSMWQIFCRLMRSLGIQYVHMVDGRELPGGCANPSLQLIQGENYLGRQLHERDGAYVYWPFNEFTGDYHSEMYYDLWMHLYHQMQPGDDATPSYQLAPSNLVLQDEQLYLYRDPLVSADMGLACDYFLCQLRRSRYDAIRHTGTTVLFRYIFQAGYSWVGAELMYGPMELVIASLRGAAKCYGQEKLGGHLAVQWSTSPHDTRERYERYRLALFVSYIQGLTDINTEEGLWHLEEYYSSHHRFSPACQNHLKIHRDFNRYIFSHTRPGKFYTPIAFLQGRFDGWHCFGRNTIWGQREMRFDKPEESWDLLKLFYPRSHLDAIYRHPCQEGPVGFYTGTPYGNVDLIPIESPLFDKYKLIFMLGYNKCEAEDCDKFMEYVNAGGILLIGWPHLATTTLRADVVAYSHDYIRHSLVDMLGGSQAFIPLFIQDTKDGETIAVAKNLTPADCKVLARTDHGNILACEYEFGKGKLVFINAQGYPAENGLCGVYTAIMKTLTDNILAGEGDKGIIRCDDTVQYALYQQPDHSRHIFLMAVDTWYNRDQEARKATLCLGSHTAPIEVPPGKLVKLVINGSVAAWLADDVGEILELKLDGATADVLVQGYGTSELSVAHNGNVSRRSLDFSQSPLLTVRVEV
jgi:hypothetical protein